MKYTSIFIILIFLISACGNDSPPQKVDENKPADPIVVPVNNPVDTVSNLTEINDADAEKENSSSKEAEKIPEKVKPQKDKKLKEKDKPAEPKILDKSISEVKPNQEVTVPQKEPVIEKPPVTTAPVPEKEVKIEETSKPAPFSHELFDQLLQKYVSATGKVNYKGLKSEQAKLEEYLNLLENTALEGDWARSKKMAYWINAYNAYTIKLILDNYPISSITKLEGGKPWDKKWIKLDGKTLSLNNIENDILRPQYKDARIHFAVNCAAKSCPPLLNRAWTEKNLNSNLDKQARAFINNPLYNKLSEKEVTVSKIFEWYAQDFGDLIDYLNKYSNTKIMDKAKINFMEYDWVLNQ